MARRRDQLETVIDGTESVVPLATRRDLTFARQELVDGDIERVRAGMELLSWTYDENEWQRHVTASAGRIEPAEDLNTHLVRSLFGKGGRTEWVVARLQELPLPTVLLTSTGILFGEIARPWRGQRRLARADVEKRDPTYLVLTFEKYWGVFHWATRELWVPMPRAIEHDADELAATLNGWSGRGRPPPLNP